MAEFYSAPEVRRRLERQLGIPGWKRVRGGKAFRIELPVVLYFNYQRLVLFVTPTDDGYTVSDNGRTFSEYSAEGGYYYGLFSEGDTNYHFEIEYKRGRISKDYRFDYSLISAIDEFIRLFILLDEFMRRNDIT